MILAQVAPQGGAILSLMPLIFIFFFVFYFLLIMPQQKKQKAHKKMLDELKEGDKIVTVGGAMGVVGKIKDNVVTLEFRDGVKIDYLKSAVSQVMKPQNG